ncbi:hypothetical protein BVY04_00465, partial [bacterium M21]
MEPAAESRVVLEIDLTKIRSNYEIIAKAVQPLNVMAVLKANAYGLGVLPIAQSLKDAGVNWFGTAELGEALAIRHLGLPVQILGGVIADEIPAAVANGIILPITDLETAKLISAESVRQDKVTACHFLIDTGMGRLGILRSEAEAIVTEAVKLPGLN